jgi:hypothetical protein
MMAQMKLPSLYINQESINISGENQYVAVHYSDVNMSDHPNQMSTALADNELAVSCVSESGQEQTILMHFTNFLFCSGEYSLFCLIYKKRNISYL